MKILNLTALLGEGATHLIEAKHSENSIRDDALNFSEAITRPSGTLFREEGLIGKASPF